MNVLEHLEKHIIPAAKLNADGIPSASIAILDDGKISAHVISNGKENNETVYQACSISKAITAIGVAKLVDDGRISYDTKVADHLGQTTIDCLVDDKTSHFLSDVTVGMLLSHTSGLSQGGFPGYDGKTPSAEEVLSGRYPSNTPRVRFLSFPGAQFKYSGGGFTVLQVFLENVTKTPFANFMKATVLEPLGMSRSWYGDLQRNEENFTKAHRTGYTESGCHSFIELAAAYLWTTPTDLLKAVSAVQESLYTDHGFVSRATAKKMLSHVVVASFFGGHPLYMAMGWAVNEHIFAHSGENFPGYNTYVFGFHSDNTSTSGSESGHKPRNGIAVMTNSSLGHEMAIRQIIGAILYLKGWERTQDLPSLFGSDNEHSPYAAPEGVEVGDGWRDWIGKWEGDWAIVDDGGPALRFKSFKPMKLRPAAAPMSVAENGKQEFVFAVDGLEFGLRLAWDDGNQVIHLLQSPTKVLKKTE
jgi:CubicO group peptidase (beta-lactamase class C family)